MNKSFKRAVCLALGALTAFSMVGCKKKENSSSDPEEKERKYAAEMETRPVVFSIAALDGNFNPYFATSAPDVTIAAQTQISMMTTDADGNPVCGEDWPTVALDYTETKSSDAIGDTTEYEFLIKNGIKFSDGEPLTIADVLFNLYVYLDPMYMGSATIYSTKIRGLEAYRTQDPDADANSAAMAETGFYAKADARITNIENYLYGETDSTEEIEADIATMKELHKEALKTAWTSAEGAFEGYAEKYTFDEAWEIFYFENGLIYYQTTKEGTNDVKKTDANGKYLTELDPDEDNNDKVEAQHLIDEIAAVKADEEPDYKKAVYMENYDCTEEQAISYMVRDFAIDKVLEDDFGSDMSMLSVLYSLRYSTLRDEFVAEARDEYFDGLKEDNDGGLEVPNISGITVREGVTSFNGKDLGEEHHVLKIVIDKIDPKAIWNMAFTVSPMHYYSSKKLANEANWKENRFGVDFGNKEFFDTVLQAPEKNRLPVGAGTYMATNMAGDDLDVTKNEGSEFYKNYWVYYKRNPYFETVGDGLCNAHIKYMRYKVVSSDQLLNSLINEEVDVGEPNATQNNINRLGQDDIKTYLDYRNYLANGYGYVGVNPKFVPDIEVRQAIMKAMDVNMTVEYYTEALAEVIRRPMSITSWAYPKDNGKPVGVYDEGAYEGVKVTRVAKEITDLVESAPSGWSRTGNEVYKNDNGDSLEITFTIAGDTKDHPAYGMFQDAATFLNTYCGFDVEVVTDVSALRKLATGDLAVWAAAWSSALDPDLYQVYHKDSKATSVKNWGYEQILNGPEEQFGDEADDIRELSKLIDKARTMTGQEDRAAIYKDALDLIMGLYVELPTYQRNDLVVFNKEWLDPETLNQNPSATSSVFDKIWELCYN